MSPRFTLHSSPHLSDIELVDYADGVLPPARVDHVARCERCRAQAETLGAMAREALHADVPEPSPLFWEHLPGRVRDAVREVGVPAARPRWHAPAWAGAAVVAIAIAAAMRIEAPFFKPIPPARTGPAAAPSTGSMVSDAPVAADLESDQEWALVRDAAADLHWDAAHKAGLDARPGAAERVALELSADERQELARLIEREVKSSGS